jgi:hypothetical protein
MLSDGFLCEIEWNISTVHAIEAGIQSAYAESAMNDGAIYDGIAIHWDTHQTHSC